MSSIKILPSIISFYAKEIIYDSLFQNEESSKKKDIQIEWMKVQNIILQKTIISLYDNCLSLKKEISFFKQNNISTQNIYFDTTLPINKKNHDFISVISERDIFLSTFNDLINIQYEILEDYLLKKIKNFSINDDGIYVWELDNISPRLYMELCFDQKHNSFWKNKDGEITFFVNIFNKTNNEFNLIVNEDGIDGFDAIVKKINYSK